ncbi:MAG: FAD-binding protein, partial [Bryobacteraceae bacterium]
MHRIVPESAEELAAALRECSAKRRSIELLGNGTKRLMGGPVGEAEVAISTAGTRRIVEYEPGDLTVSVEAGMPFGELQRQLREQGQT